MPISEKQLAANRANATKSTGPTSSEGRARSAQNSRKHGFTAAKFVITGVEDAQDLENLKADILETYQPVNRMELLTCERIATSFFIVQRCAQLEAGLFTNYLNIALHSDNLMEELAEKIEPASHQSATFNLGAGFHFECKRDRNHAFGLFLRYKAQAEREYRRWVEEFERLRKLRDHFAPFPNEPISDAPIAPGPASPNEPIPGREAPEPERSEDLPPAPSPQSPAPGFSPASGSRPPAPDDPLAPTSYKEVAPTA
jgi:hypothetical protein